MSFIKSDSELLLIPYLLGGKSARKVVFYEVVLFGSDWLWSCFCLS